MKKAAHHRRSPRLVAAERQANDEALSSMETNDNAKQQDSSSWNETSFDPYVSSSPVVRQTPHDAQEAPKEYNRRVARSTANSSSGGRHMMPAPAITTRIDVYKMEKSDVPSYDQSMKTTLERPLDSRKVSFAQDCQVEYNHTGQSDSLETPAFQGNILGASQPVSLPVPPLQIATRRMRKVTPQEREASLALAALCMQSDGRNGLLPHTANQYLEKVPTKRSKDERKFPELVHALVSEMNATAPHVLQWVDRGEAFIIREPQSPILAAALQKLFDHSNCSSFHRQLNMYGWSKKKDGRNKGAFVNPHFHQDLDRSALSSIKRRPPGCHSHPTPSSKRTAIAQEQTSAPVETKRLTPSKKRKCDAPARNSKTPPSEPQKAARARTPKRTPVQTRTPVSNTPVETKKSTLSIKQKRTTPARSSKTPPSELQKAARARTSKRTPVQKEAPISSTPVETKKSTPSIKQKCTTAARSSKTPPPEPQKAALSRKPKRTPVQKEAPILSTPVETKKSTSSITLSRNTKSQPGARKSAPSRTPKRKTPPVQTKNPVSSNEEKRPSSTRKRKSPLAEMEKPVPPQTQKMPCTLPAQPKNEFVEQHATPSRTQVDPAFVRGQEMPPFGILKLHDSQSEKNALLAVIRTRESPRTRSSAAGKSPSQQGSQDSSTKLVTVIIRVQDVPVILSDTKNVDCAPADLTVESNHQNTSTVAAIPESVQSSVKVRLEERACNEHHMETLPATESLSNNAPCFTASPPPKICNYNAASPIEFEGIQFASLGSFSPVQEDQKLPFLVDEENQASPSSALMGEFSMASFDDIDLSGTAKHFRVTLHDGTSISTSPLIKVSTGNNLQKLASPMDRITAPQDRVPPPVLPLSRTSSFGSIPTPLSLKQCSSPSDSLVPFLGFSRALSSALDLHQDRVDVTVERSMDDSSMASAENGSEEELFPSTPIFGMSLDAFERQDL